MCLVSPDEGLQAWQGGWDQSAQLAEYPQGSPARPLALIKEDANYLDNFDGPVHLWPDDWRPYRIVGTKDRKLRHIAAAMLGPFCVVVLELM